MCWQSKTELYHIQSKCLGVEPSLCREYPSCRQVATGLYIQEYNQGVCVFCREYPSCWEVGTGLWFQEYNQSVCVLCREYPSFRQVATGLYIQEYNQSVCVLCREYPSWGQVATRLWIQSRYLCALLRISFVPTSCYLTLSSRIQSKCLWLEKAT